MDACAVSHRRIASAVVAAWWSMEAKVKELMESVKDENPVVRAAGNASITDAVLLAAMKGEDPGVRPAAARNGHATEKVRRVTALDRMSAYARRLRRTQRPTRRRGIVSVL